MRQSMKLYFVIKKSQFTMALLLGLLLAVVSLTSSFLWQNITVKYFNEQFGPLVSSIWILIAAATVLNDQIKHLETWLYTQNISRKQLFITRVILLIILPILVSSLMDIILTLITHPKSVCDIIANDAVSGVQLFFMASVMALVYTLIGPIWMKIMTAIFMLIVVISPILTVEKIDHIFHIKMFEHSDVLQTFLANVVILFLALIVFIFAGYLSTKISADTIDNAVRLHYFRWPVVIFAFVSLFITLMVGNRSSLTIEVVLNNMILPAIITVVTFVFVFKPKLKLTWDK